MSVTFMEPDTAIRPVLQSPPQAPIVRREPATAVRERPSWFSELLQELRDTLLVGGELRQVRTIQPTSVRNGQEVVKTDSDPLNVSTILKRAEQSRIWKRPERIFD